MCCQWCLISFICFFSLNVKCLPIGQSCLLHTWDAVASPTQSFPPYLGTGAVQRRLRVWIPPLQVTVQMSQGDQGPQPPLTKKWIKSNIHYLASTLKTISHTLGLKCNLLGQGDFWQISVWRPSPSQSMPPIWGVGELQRRIRVMTPSPQVTEHEDQGDQWLQPPSCLTVSST